MVVSRQLGFRANVWSALPSFELSDCCVRGGAFVVWVCHAGNSGRCANHAVSLMFLTLPAKAPPAIAKVRQCDMGRRSPNRGCTAKKDVAYLDMTLESRLSACHRNKPINKNKTNGIVLINGPVTDRGPSRPSNQWANEINAQNVVIAQ